jgi:hypothetical protein
MITTAVAVYTVLVVLLVNLESKNKKIKKNLKPSKIKIK